MTQQPPPRSRKGNWIAQNIETLDGEAFAADIWLNGETRRVVFDRIYQPGRRVGSANVAVAQKGSGSKLWPVGVDLWRDEDGNWTYHHCHTILNRTGYRAIAWNEDIRHAYYSQHNSSHAPS